MAEQIIDWSKIKKGTKLRVLSVYVDRHAEVGDEGTFVSWKAHSYKSNYPEGYVCFETDTGDRVSWRGNRFALVTPQKTSPFAPVLETVEFANGCTANSDGVLNDPKHGKIRAEDAEALVADLREQANRIARLHCEYKKRFGK